MKNEEKSKENTAEGENKLEYIEKTGTVISRRDGETIHCLTVIGQIEGHYQLPEGQKATQYEHLIPLLVSIEESREIDGMLMVLNTMGGDVEAGLALAEMVASMKKPTVSLVLGGGHSIGVPLAVSARKSFIVPSATMTVHPVRMSGTVIGVPQTYYYFERMQDRIVRFVTAHSGVSEDCLREMLLRTDQIASDVGSLIDGDEAVRCGLIDRVGGLADALEALRKMIRQEKRNEETKSQAKKKPAAQEAEKVPRTSRSREESRGEQRPNA
ncbi:MAG: ATP-dependent Clp protease proteolytic subunit [Oscillospiraceae bacterium]|nr:ATP-dependent Clp protease proteolytic subunit [Oscillospiraceae bacterium]